MGNDDLQEVEIGFGEIFVEILNHGATKQFEFLVA